MTRTVFISHSCEDNTSLPQASRDMRARTRAVRDQIEKGLEGVEGLTAWIDKFDVEPGQEWRKEIHKALFDCSAAVILLDDEAFNSPWVLKETTVLSVRRSLLTGFPMVPVLLDQGSSDQFDKRPEWKALGMREIQAMKRPPDQVAKLVVDLVRDAAEVDKEGAFESWVDAVFGILLAFGPQKVTLDRIAKILQVPQADDWTANGHRAVRTLALALTASDDLFRVARVLKELTTLPQERRETIRRLLVPAWVKPSRAALTAWGLRSPEVGRRLILGTEDELVAQEHLNRAECCSARLVLCKPLPVQGEDEYGDLLFDECASAIHAVNPMAEGVEGEKFAVYLANFGNDPVVLRLAPGAMPVAVLRNVLDRLQTAFPGIAILLLTDDVTSLAGDLAPQAPLELIPTLTVEEIKTRAGYEAQLDLFVKGS